MNQKDTRKKLICELVDDKLYVPMKEKELAVFLQVSREDREALKEVLEELLAEGKLELTKRGRYKKPEETYVSGTFIGNQQGFGFLEGEGWRICLFRNPEWAARFREIRCRPGYCRADAGNGRKRKW